jgi:quinol monooxygenase YgiN
MPVGEGAGMSVLVVGTFRGDTATFRKALEERPEDFTRLADKSKAAGAIHHRFGVGDGVVVIVDEWESAEQFQAFMAEPEVMAFASVAGAAGPPEVTITEAVSSPDQF